MPHYLVTMELPEEADRPVLPVGEMLRHVREALLPSLEALAGLAAQGKVLTGGYPVGDRSMMLIVEADSEEEAREVLEGLPLWDAETSTVRRMHIIEELMRDPGRDPGGDCAGG